MDNQENKPVKIWKRKNIHLVNKDNDIKFRGPLSYRHLRILGWLSLLLAQLGTILVISSNVGLISLHPIFSNIFSSFSYLMTPLFLFAAFAQVLMAKDGYLRLLRTYGLGALGLYILFAIVYFHFIIGLLSALNGGYSEAFSQGQTILDLINSNAPLSFNIFIDLLLCTLVTFFINYRPSKYFQGKKIYIFRSLVALPLLYELGSIILKIAAISFEFSISPFVLPLLTTKPPVAFLIFVALAIFIKVRERHYIKQGKTHKDYKEFLNTNVNRLHFALFLVFSILFAVILDALIYVILYLSKAMTIPDTAENYEELLVAIAQQVYSLGFGKCLIMLLIIPALIFFDYTKTYENKLVDIIIPVAGVALLIVLTIEGFFEVGRAYVIQSNKSPDKEVPEETAQILFKAYNKLSNCYHKYI